MTDRKPGSNRKARVVGLVALSILAVVFLTPVYVMVVASVKPPNQADAIYMWQLPESLETSGIEQAWAKLKPNFVNSLLLVLPATIISSTIGALNGFIFAKMPFRGSNVLFASLLLGMFIPYQVVLIPIVRFLQYVNLYGSISGLILVHVVYGIPITTLIFRNYYEQIPSEILEASQVDGATPFQAFTRLMLPLSLPGFVVAGIFQFTNIWNDFIFGITVIPDPAKQPITVALNNLSGTLSIEWNAVMAGALIAAIPTALVYVVLGKYFVQGLTSGSVK